MQSCSNEPTTGFDRFDRCKTGPVNKGGLVVWARMPEAC